MTLAEQQAPDKWEPKPAISAAELKTIEIPPVQFVVDDLIPEGLVILAAPAKFYKSWFCLDLAECVAEGRDFFGHKCSKGHVLYYDNESTNRRPKERLEKMNSTFPENLILLTGDRGTGTDFLKDLGYYLMQYPDTKLVIIDVLQRIRTPTKKNQTGYEKDYEELIKLKDLADMLHVCIIAVTHFRKASDEQDAFNQIMGSVGAFAVSDAGIVIVKESREAKEAKFVITGRDLEGQNLQAEFNTERMRWQLIGNAEDIERRRQMEQHEAHPITRTVCALVAQGGGKWTGTPSDIQRASKYLDGGKNLIYDDARRIGRYLNNHESDFKIFDQIGFKRERTDKERKYVFFNVSNVINKPNVITSGNVMQNDIMTLMTSDINTSTKDGLDFLTVDPAEDDISPMFEKGKA